MSTPPEAHRAGAPVTLGFGILVVSDSRTPATDRSGTAAAELAVAAGHRVVDRRLVADEAAAIRAAAGALLAVPEVDAVVVSGGTGFSPRDVTVGALQSLFTTPVEGFGELFRALSFAEIGAAAMLSRAAAGVVGRKVLYLLPGSPAAVRLAMERLILPETGHLLGQVRRPA